jgi:DNA-binding NarL/FixJ family response regulator
LGEHGNLKQWDGELVFMTVYLTPEFAYLAFQTETDAMAVKPAEGQESDQPFDPAPAKPRVLLADDHTLVAEALTSLLEPEFEIVGRVPDGRILLETAMKLRPDVIVVDLNMPLLNGIDAGRRLKEMLPTARMVVLTVNEDPEVAGEALRTWASGFLLKKSAASELSRTIRQVLRGGAGIAHSEPASQSSSTGARNLTVRQREVLQLLAEGRSMKEAGAVLGVTARTIAFHKYKIMQVFGLRNNSDLIQLAISEHLIPNPEA